MKGDHITTFVSGGPKNYAYETNTQEKVCKVRGLTLNYRTAIRINYNVLCDMVKSSITSDVNDVLYVNIPFTIVRDKKSKAILTRSETKK